MIILASSSPRRSELLRNAGVEFMVQTSDVLEEHRLGERPTEFARRLAAEKARAVARQNPAAFVLGADTIVVVKGEILGKPADSSDAVRMLTSLSGNDHLVTTAVCLVTPEGAELVESETTRVFFSMLSSKEIESYVATGEPMDKAGAYAIQGRASKWIYRIEGDYYNVMGLPLARVWEMLKRAQAI